ncbi:hypothetical protein ACFFRR_009968 [Megaselia abdita]
MEPENQNFISSLPFEMIGQIASFLDHQSLLTFSRVNSLFYSGLSYAVVSKSWYQFSRNNYYHRFLQKDLMLHAKHIVLSIDWSLFEFPCTEFIISYLIRGQSPSKLQSIQLEFVKYKEIDLKNMLMLANQIRVISFGYQKISSSHLKTVALTTSTNLGNAANLLTGIQKIIVRPYGPFTADFIETLQTLISTNYKSLRELDLEGPFLETMYVDFPREMKLQLIRTTTSITQLMEEGIELMFARTLKCSVVSENPVWRFSPNTLCLSINIETEDWRPSQIPIFFPNLAVMELTSTYRQTELYDEQKVTLNNIVALKATYYGIKAALNFICPNLETLEIRPLSEQINKHFSKYSPKIRYITGQDNILEDRKKGIIQGLIINNKMLRSMHFSHNATACVCDIFEFVEDMYEFFEEQKYVKAKIIFNFRADIKRKRSLSKIISKATHESIQYFEFVDSSRIDVSNNVQIFIKFVEIQNMRRQHF